MSLESNSGPAPFFDGHPAEIVAAIYGSDTIKLGGFEAEPMPGPWLRPSLRFVSADLPPAEGGISAELDARARAIRWTRRGIGTALLVSLLSLAFWLGVGARPAPTEASSRWFVAGVSAQGVTVTTDFVDLLIAPGEKLPNGEVLQAVLPERSTYVTDHATVVVQAQLRQAQGSPLPLPSPAPAATARAGIAASTSPEPTPASAAAR